MCGELHLFIIWSNAEYQKDKIIEDIQSRFKVIGIHKVTWDKKHFSGNLTRFYGENLPKNSNKEKLCGNDPFTLVVVMDEQPLYRTRMTSKGAKVVNVNLFDSKEMYRYWTGGGHMIHGTNSEAEVRHDLILLTGCSKDDYIEKFLQNGSQVLCDEFTDMPGENAWQSIEQILYVLNETVDYVILRNFNELFADYSKRIHGDIDILSSNPYLTRLALNAAPVHHSRYRVQHLVKIGEGGTFVDIRYVGDDYYCKEWEKNILKNKRKSSKGYFRPDDENFLYALLYHALVQKKTISDDYFNIFYKAFPELEKVQDKQSFLKDRLLRYLADNNYEMREPLDYTVYFNEEVTGRNMSARKFALKAVHKLIR